MSMGLIMFGASNLRAAVALCDREHYLVTLNEALTLSIKLGNLTQPIDVMMSKLKRQNA